MEDLLTVIFVVIAIIIKVRSGIKKTAEETSSSPTEQPIEWEGENPPYVVVEDEEVVEGAEQKSKVEQMMAMLVKPKDTEQKPVAKVAIKPVVNQPVVKPIEMRKVGSPSEHNISRELRTTQGARKAFIYSEIFKRKYE